MCTASVPAYTLVFASPPALQQEDTQQFSVKNKSGVSSHSCIKYWLIQYETKQEEDKCTELHKGG